MDLIDMENLYLVFDRMLIFNFYFFEDVNQLFSIMILISFRVYLLLINISINNKIGGNY